MEQGASIQIEIRADPRELTLSGFMIQARTNTMPYKIVGRFTKSPDDTDKVLNCHGDQNTATHATPAPKVDVILTWRAPLDWVGDVYFM